MTPGSKAFLRLAAWLVALISLPYAGYVWTLPEREVIALAAGVTGILTFSFAQYFAWSVESDAFHLGQLVREDQDDFDQWKKRVDILSGVVGILYQDGADLKKGLLVGEIDPTVHRQAGNATSAEQKQKLIEADDLLALPKYDTPGMP